MIAKWLLGAIGLHVPMIHHQAPDVTKAVRRASAAAFQHNRIVTKATTAALDMVDQQEADERPSRMLEDAKKTRAMIEQMLERMK